MSSSPEAPWYSLDWRAASHHPATCPSDNSFMNLRQAGAKPFNCSLLPTLFFLSFSSFHHCCRLESAVFPNIVLSFSFPDAYLQVCLKPKLKGELWGLGVKKKLGKLQELSLPGKVVNILKDIMGGM